MREPRENFTDVPYQSPGGQVEEAIARIWPDVLGVDRVGAADSIYDFAGTSMNAVSICARIQDEFGVEVLPKQVFDADTLEDLINTLITDEPVSASLLWWLTDSVTQYADLPAVQCGNDSMSYAELDVWSRDLAARLLALDGGAPRRVGLWSTRSFADYAGYLAILRVGATVVPLNPAFPAERLNRMCELARLEATVGPAQAVPPMLATTIPLVEPGSRIDPDAAASTIAAIPVPQPQADDVAYILFTSGSTGTPKGVPITHENASSYLAHVVERYELGPGCRLSQTFDLTFDPSVFDLFAALGTGATAVLPRPGDLLDPVRYINDQALTHWFSVPSVISAARRLSKLEPASMPALRMSMFIGEQLTVEHAAAWASAAPHSVLENVYGPTEATVSCTVYRLPANREDWPATDNGTVPIGFPHAGTEIVMQDDGELLLRGSQRFAGYLDAEDDSGRFVPTDLPVTAEHWYRTGDRAQLLADGCLVHRGRLDTQVKLNGYRMELGEIETAIRDDKRILDCVVLVVEDSDGFAGLHAVYSGTWTAPRELIAGLRRALPDYMVPRRFTRLEELPRTANGKTDRRAVALLVEAGNAASQGTKT